jgi:hypothetical protein
MKTYGEMELLLHPFLTSIPDADQRPASLSGRKRPPGIHIVKIQRDNQSSHSGEKKNPCP